MFFVVLSEPLLRTSCEGEAIQKLFAKCFWLWGLRPTSRNWVKASAGRALQIFLFLKEKRKKFDFPNLRGLSPLRSFRKARTFLVWISPYALIKRTFQTRQGPSHVRHYKELDLCNGVCGGLRTESILELTLTRRKVRACQLQNGAWRIEAVYKDPVEGEPSRTACPDINFCGK